MLVYSKLRANRHTETLPHLVSFLLSDRNTTNDFSRSICHTFNVLAADTGSDRETLKESVDLVGSQYS